MPVQVWEDDPGAPLSGRIPIMRPTPSLDGLRLPIQIDGSASRPVEDEYSTVHLYWAVVDALKRGDDLWRPHLPAHVTWHPAVGSVLTAIPDGANLLNAYYDRHEGILLFCHYTVGRDITVYSGESPDVVSHELGHAILDGLRPDILDNNLHEQYAMHEAFGDISSMLSALQLESFRTAVLAETHNFISTSSRLSRIAEQLGWGMHQYWPDIAEADCLRNAANHFLYRDPLTLPSDAPITELSRKRHSFARVFTSAFLRATSRIFDANKHLDADGLLETSQVMSKLLVQALINAPQKVSYYAQVAANMIAADYELFDGSHAQQLKAAFVDRGILATAEANRITAPKAQLHLRELAEVPADLQRASLRPIMIDGERYGVTTAFSALVSAEPQRLAATDPLELRSPEPGQTEHAARLFIEDLFKHGQVKVPKQFLVEPPAEGEELGPQTHEIVADGDGLRLVARWFD